jgi:hypothetical protein
VLDSLAEACDIAAARPAPSQRLEPHYWRRPTVICGSAAWPRGPGEPARRAGRALVAARDGAGCRWAGSQLAGRLIAAAGLTVGHIEAVQAAIPSGLAMMTRPPAATAVAPGTRVGLVVSRGAPTITVPDLMGLTPVDARVRLEQAGLELGGVTRRRMSGATPGTIIAQRPAAATLAAPGTLVDIIVARSLQ